MASAPWGLARERSLPAARGRAPLQQRCLEGLSSSSASGSIRPSSTSPGPPAQRRLPTELEQMISLLDQRVTQVTQAENARLRLLSDQSQRLLEGLQAMRVAREIHEERRQKELRLVESSALLDINKAAQERKELEARMEELGSNSLAEALEEFRREDRRLDLQKKDLTHELGEGIKRLTGLLEEQRASRGESGEHVAESLEARFAKVEQALAAETNLRTEAGGQMAHMVEDVSRKIASEIQQERSQREAVQGRLLGLLEETCNRIEISFSNVPEAERQDFAASFSRSSPGERLMI